MKTKIGGKFGMERRRQQMPLPDGHRIVSPFSFHLRQHFYAGPRFHNERCPDKDGSEVFGNPFHIQLRLKAVHLTPEGIPTYTGVQEPDAGLVHA